MKHPNTIKQALQTLTFIGLLLILGQAGAIGTTPQDRNPAIKLYVLDCGHIAARDISLFNPAIEKGTKMDLANPCYLVQHPKGNLLWEAGINDKIADKPDGLEVMGGAFNFSVKKTLASQLKEINVSHDQVNFLSFSHLHRPCWQCSAVQELYLADSRE